MACVIWISINLNFINRSHFILQPLRILCDIGLCDNSAFGHVKPHDMIYLVIYCQLNFIIMGSFFGKSQFVSSSSLIDWFDTWHLLVQHMKWSCSYITRLDDSMCSCGCSKGGRPSSQLSTPQNAAIAWLSVSLYIWGTTDGSKIRQMASTWWNNNLISCLYWECYHNVQYTLRHGMSPVWVYSHQLTYLVKEYITWTYLPTFFAKIMPSE